MCLNDGNACSERRFMCQHLSGYRKCFEVYYRSFTAADEGFHFHCLEAGGGIIAPHCTGGSRGWRLAAAEGAYRLLARCEILPCMLFLLVPDPLLPRELGCHSFPPEAEKKKAVIWCFIVLVSCFSGCFLTKRESFVIPFCFIFIHRHMTVRNSLSLSFFLMIPHKFRS